MEQLYLVFLNGLPRTCPVSFMPGRQLSEVILGAKDSIVMAEIQTSSDFHMLPVLKVTNFFGEKLKVPFPGSSSL